MPLAAGAGAGTQGSVQGLQASTPAEEFLRLPRLEPASLPWRPPSAPGSATAAQLPRALARAFQAAGAHVRFSPGRPAIAC